MNDDPRVEQLQRALDGYLTTHLLAVVSQLGIAEHLVIDIVLPERAEERPAAVRLDLTMLMLFGSRERSEPEWRSLLGGGGFALERVIPTGSSTGIAVLEATPLGATARRG
jgi:hypothetical protein